MRAEVLPVGRGSPSGGLRARLGSPDKKPGGAGSRPPPRAPIRPGRRPPGWEKRLRTSSRGLPRGISHGELLAQAPESARRSRLDGAEGHAGPLRNLPLGEAPEIGELYYLSVRRVEFLQGPRHPP